MKRDKMLLQSLLLLAALQGSAQGLPVDADIQPSSTTFDAAQPAKLEDGYPSDYETNNNFAIAEATASPCNPIVDLTPLIQNQLQEAQWRGEALSFLSQLVSGQKEVSGGQAEVAKLLGTLATQGAQQIVNLQNLARHQSLLVENHQALLLQTSRIVTLLQDMTKKPPQST